MIPKILHYCFGMAADGGGKPWSLIHYACLKSAVERIKPTEVFFYCEFEPTGPWWDLSRELVKVERIQAPREIFGNPVAHFAHRADIVRLEKLLSRGGIYLDADVFVHKAFDDLLGHATVLGRQVVNPENLGLCNAVILAQPQASFLKRWHSEYRSFRSNGHDSHWDEHSVQVPNKLSEQFPDEVTVLSRFAFFWPTFEEADLTLIFNSSKPIDLSPAYATHLWESVAWERYLEHLTPRHVRSSDTNFHRWVRPMIAALPDDYGAATIRSRFARSVRRLKRRVRSAAPSSQPELSDAFSVEHLHADLKGRSVRAGAQSMAAQVAQILLQSVATVMLARLLSPVDFGLVAMVTAVTAIAAAFADLGLTEATIQRKEISHRQVSTLFWINVGMGLLLTIITAVMAPVLAWFYKEPRLLGITLAVSPTFFIGGLRAQHNALLKRQMRFSSIAIRDVAAYAFAVPVAVALAWSGAGYWAIVALPMTLNLAQLAISWRMVAWRPGPPRRDSEIRSMVGFGGNVAASYFVFNWIRNADNILIGWYWGAGPLGLYSRAFNLLTLALSQINAPASSVALPAMSRTQGEPELFAKYYLRTVNVIMWIIAALFGFLFVAAKPVIVLVLGNKWIDAAPVFRILAVSVVGQMLLESILWLFVSRGQSGRLLKLLLIISPLMIASFAIGLPFGIKWVALALTIFLLISLPWILKFAFSGTNLTLGRLAKALQCPILVSLAGVLFAESAMRLIAPQSMLSQLAVAALGFAIIYSLAFLIPAVRKEINSLWKLFSELRLSRQPTA